MSLTFKFDKLNENNPKKRDGKKDMPGAEKDIEVFDKAGQVRNVCFIETDGKCLFLNYSYLVSGEFSPADRIITLTFTTHTIILKGHNLESLFEEFIEHLPKLIKCIDKRYEAMKDKSEGFVTEIIVKSE